MRASYTTRMPPAQDLRGRQFHRLTVVGPTEHRVTNKRLWLCRCVCGNFTCSVADNLRSGATKSCGCWNTEVRRTQFLKHGESHRTPEYETWKRMTQRCYNPKNPKFSAYGGRGITVCRRWRHDFSAFLADMGRRPTGTTLDRINNEGPYSPKNCRWATLRQQARNRRDNRNLMYAGTTRCLREWAEVLQIPERVLRIRLQRGWTVHEAMTTTYRKGQSQVRSQSTVRS